MASDKSIAMEKFKQFCIEENVAKGSKKLDESQEQDWFSLSLGFFKALGISNASCHTLAIKARYTHHYWC